jgi:hypothetical protein
VTVDPDVEALPELLRQTEVARAKNGSLVATEHGKLIRRPFFDPPDRFYRLQEGAMKMMRKNVMGRGPCQERFS